MPAKRLIIVVWSCGPDRPQGAVLAAAPFVYALAARALEVEVEMHFTSSAVRWLVQGVADGAHTDRQSTKTVGDFIAEARQSGVRLFACGMARAEHLRADERLIDGVHMAGAATVIDCAILDDARTLVF